MLFNLINFKFTLPYPTQAYSNLELLISFVNTFQYILVVFNCNVLVFSKNSFINKFDLFWTTTLFLPSD